MFYTGIDQHRTSSVLTTLTEQGERVMQRTLPNDRRLLTDYFAQWPGEHRAVVEATGRWYWLRDLLAPQGIDLRWAHAKFLKAIAYAKVKTDAVDSDTLAQLLRTGLIPEAHMITEAQRGPRDVLRTRLRLVERRSGRNKRGGPVGQAPLPHWTRQRVPARDWEARRLCRGEDLGRGRVTALRSPHRARSRAPNGV